MRTMSESRASFRALGTTAVVVATDPSGLEPARRAVEEVIEDFDRACSRFREDSELSKLNGAEGEPVRASPLLIDAVAAALRAARLTDGDVDPTVGKALIALGYDRDFEALAGGRRPPGRASIAAVPGWQTVFIDPEASTIHVARGVVLDLGATAKALAADRAAARAATAAGCGVLVSLGGDISLAGAPPEEGWRIRVTDDHRAGVSAPGQWIMLRSGGLATSSTTVRTWETEAGSAHHLLDPATSHPVSGAWRTVSVTAATCLDANIASTAAIVRGGRAPEWLDSIGLPSRLVTTEGTVRHVAGWPSEGDDLPEARS
jgi:thiamine biosynthesis lipoprotein